MAALLRADVNTIRRTRLLFNHELPRGGTCSWQPEHARRRLGRLLRPRAKRPQGSNNQSACWSRERRAIFRFSSVT